MTDRKLSVAILGAGIGAEHLTGYLANPARFDVKVICDRDRARAAPLIDQSTARWSDSVSDTIAQSDVDIIDICLPPALHLPTMLDALTAGKHVVCEKPLVASLREIDQVAEAANSAGKTVTPVFQYRFGQGLSQLKSCLLYTSPSPRDS